jgi:GNAT superfamily N-acetyltransferase
VTTDLALRIERLAAADADDLALTTRLTDLINEVYRVAEDGLWVPGTPRTGLTELTDLVRAGEIAVARRGEAVGCVRIHSLDANTSQFGMLAADPALRRTGIGRELVAFAERLARRDGHDTMELELLRPKTWVHPAKEFLAAWYRRIGYVTVRTVTVEGSYPALAPLLATPCDVLIFHKDLR